MKKLYLNKINAGILCITSILLVLICSTASAEEGGNNEIELNFSFSEPTINNVNISNNTYHNISINNTFSYGDVNKPILPIKTYMVLLPQKGIIQSINVTCEGNTSLGENYNITLGTNSTNCSIGYQYQTNTSGFNTSIPYPTESFSNCGILNFRGYWLHPEIDN